MGSHLRHRRAVPARPAGRPGDAVPPPRLGHPGARRPRSGGRLRLRLDGPGGHRFQAGRAVRYLLGGLLLLPAAVLQVTLAPRLEVFGAFPNLVLLVVVGWTLVRGAGAGIRWGIAGGLLLDLLAPGPLGVHALALVVAAYGTGFL